MTRRNEKRLGQFKFWKASNSSKCHEAKAHFLELNKVKEKGKGIRIYIHKIIFRYLLT